MVNKIVYFEIPANKVDRLSKFYSQCFGWKFKQESFPGLPYWTIKTGTNSIEGGMYKKQGARDLPRNYVQVDSVDKVTHRFRRAGGTVAVPKQEVPNIGFVVIGRDLEGNLIEMYEPFRGPRRRR